MLNNKAVQGSLAILLLVGALIGISYWAGTKDQKKSDNSNITKELKEAQIAGIKSATKVEQEKAAKAILKIANAWSIAREVEGDASQTLLIIAEPMEEAMLEYETPYTKGIVAPGE